MLKHATLSADASASVHMFVDPCAIEFHCRLVHITVYVLPHHVFIIGPSSGGLFFCVFCRKHIASTLKSQQQNWVSKGEGEKRLLKACEMDFSVFN